MLAAIAVVLFVIGFIINAANVATPALFSPISFLLAGLVCLAIHLTVCQAARGRGYRVARAPERR